MNLKVREWLTLDEAAQHLSLVMNETLNKAHVLRLGLDGHLKLSVYLPHGSSGSSVGDSSGFRPPSPGGR